MNEEQARLLALLLREHLTDGQIQDLIMKTLQAQAAALYGEDGKGAVIQVQALDHPKYPGVVSFTVATPKDHTVYWGTPIQGIKERFIPIDGFYRVDNPPDLSAPQAGVSSTEQAE